MGLFINQTCSLSLFQPLRSQFLCEAVNCLLAIPAQITSYRHVRFHEKSTKYSDIFLSQIKKHFPVGCARFDDVIWNDVFRFFVRVTYRRMSNEAPFPLERWRQFSEIIWNKYTIIIKICKEVNITKANIFWMKRNRSLNIACILLLFQEYGVRKKLYYRHRM